MRILVISGPNLNMLGIREKNLYGDQSYDDLLSFVKKIAKKNKIEVDFYQSNHEGAIVDKIQEAYYQKYDGIVINPAAYTHTSIAILDALRAISIPTVEVHLSDINSRESFRRKSFISEVCIKTIVGKGFDGYLDAISLLQERYKKRNQQL